MEIIIIQPVTDNDVKELTAFNKEEHSIRF